jgi:hypothetical protein
MEGEVKRVTFSARGKIRSAYLFKNLKGIDNAGGLSLSGKIMLKSAFKIIF